MEFNRIANATPSDEQAFAIVGEEFVSARSGYSKSDFLASPRMAQGPQLYIFCEVINQIARTRSKLGVARYYLLPRVTHSSA